MPELYNIDSADQAGLLWAILNSVGESAKVALEGALQETGVMTLPEASLDETANLRRQTLSPRLDFVVLPTTRRVVDELKMRLSIPGIFGEDGDLIHVQVENGGTLVFSACDNFHEECTWLAIPEGETLLRHLIATGVVKTFAA